MNDMGLRALTPWRYFAMWSLGCLCDISMPPKWISSVDLSSVSTIMQSTPKSEIKDAQCMGYRMLSVWDKGYSVFLMIVVFTPVILWRSFHYLKFVTGSPLGLCTEGSDTVRGWIVHMKISMENFQMRGSGWDDPPHGLLLLVPSQTSLDCSREWKWNLQHCSFFSEGAVRSPCHTQGIFFLLPSLHL